jgi:SpoIID/LytB domain protein
MGERGRAIVAKYRLFAVLALAVLLVVELALAGLPVWDKSSDFFGQANLSQRADASQSAERIAVSDSMVIQGPKDGYLEVTDAAGQTRKYKGNLIPVIKADGLALLNEVTLYDYLMGVVPYEMPASWPMETLKAQTVAARTFVQGRGYRVVDTDLDQVYRGIYESSYTPRVQEAVASTNGQMLLYNGTPIKDAVYSAANGGVREESRYAFHSSGQGPKLPYLPGGKDRFVLNGKEIVPEEYGLASGETVQPSPEYHWEKLVAISTIEKLWPDIGRLKSIDILERTPLGQGVLKIGLTGSRNPEVPLVVSGSQFRQRLGTTVVRSNYIKAITLLPETGQVKITGGGYGHRAGMSQWGAAGLGRLGVGYQKILSHYYPGTTLKKVVDDKTQTVQVSLKAGASQTEWRIRPSHTTQLVHSSGKTIKTLQAGQAYLLSLQGEEEPAAEVERLSGDNRYATAAAVSRQWERANVVILARGDQFADALAGVPLAYRHQGPVLLTEPDRLPAVVKEEIKRLNASKVIILGGESAVSPAVEEELSQSMGLAVERVMGANRFETAALIARRLGALSGQAVVVNGLDFPDAFSVASYAARNGYPILLAETDRLPEATRKVLQDLSIHHVFLIGGEAAVSQGVEEALSHDLGVSVERVMGDNRYLTNLAVIKRFGGLNDTVYVATGQHFADALAGSALAAKTGTGIVLTHRFVPEETQAYIRTASVSKLLVLGGPQAVPDDLARQLSLMLKRSM